jgi:hypothetical protein
LKNRGAILKIVFGIIILLWLIPAALKLTSFRDNNKLGGSFVEAGDTTISVRGWLNGTYQVKKEKYLTENFAFRTFFIKGNNQLMYSVFHTANAKTVLIGKKNYLYEKRYFTAANGEDFIGMNLLKNRMEMLKLIQDTLAKQGKLFFVIHAPSKVSIYPEFLVQPVKSTPYTNYKQQIILSKKLGLNVLNLNDLFLRLKRNSKYPLYPNTGTHWSSYGMHVGLDSICRYIEKKTGKLIPTIDYASSEHADTLREPDGDMANALNLLFAPKFIKMSYPKRVSVDSLHRVKPRFLMVSDSYWMGIYFTYLPNVIFKEHEFWYYNKQNYCSEQKKLNMDPANYNVLDEIAKKDVIAIMASEGQLDKFGWGFIEKVFETYYPTDSRLIWFKREMRKVEITNGIITNAVWKKEVMLKASKRNISFQQQLTEDVEWMLNNAK